MAVMPITPTEPPTTIPIDGRQKPATAMATKKQTTAVSKSIMAGLRGLQGGRRRGRHDLGDPDGSGDDAQHQHAEAAEEVEDAGHHQHGQDQDGPVWDDIDVPHGDFPWRFRPDSSHACRRLVVCHLRDITPATFGWRIAPRFGFARYACRGGRDVGNASQRGWNRRMSGRTLEASPAPLGAAGMPWRCGDAADDGRPDPPIRARLGLQQNGWSAPVRFAAEQAVFAAGRESWPSTPSDVDDQTKSEQSQQRQGGQHERIGVIHVIPSDTATLASGRLPSGRP